MWTARESTVAAFGLLAAAVLGGGFALGRAPLPAAAVATGALGGLFNGAFGIGGPPIILFFFSSPAGAAAGRASLIAFFLGMAASRAILLKTGIVTDIGTISAIVTASGIAGAVVLYWLVRNTPFRFLFRRPEWAMLDRKRAVTLQPAE